MIFKRCKKEYLPIIRNVLADSFANYFFPVNPSLEELDEKLESLSVDYGNSLIMYENNEPAGIAVCGVKGEVTHLGPMGIALKYQGQGYGKELLKALIELHKENGFKKIILEVICENKKAYELYKNTGFKTTRKLRGFKSGSKKLNFIPSIIIEKKSFDEVLKYFDIFHKGDNPGWQLSYECVKITKPEFAFSAYIDGKIAGYCLLKGTRIADIALKKNGLSFDVFKALISAAFAASSFIFIFDLPEEDISVKYFEDAGFEKFFDQYEMIFGLK